MRHPPKETLILKDFLGRSKKKLFGHVIMIGSMKQKKSVENFIEFYNKYYPHSTLGYIRPLDF